MSYGPSERTEIELDWRELLVHAGVDPSDVDVLAMEIVQRCSALDTDLLEMEDMLAGRHSGSTSDLRERTARHLAALRLLVRETLFRVEMNT